ncbi:MAG: hypothetical protein XXXJIFNMEKO3_00632 [Candidatus Erwinia impunctatus]|nr:hypothetical protein XXXJIFNMEKO_00632 [Culicoides impunctatus]
MSHFDTLLERAVPLAAEILERIESGELKIYGGTVRDLGGKIVKHLIFPPQGSESELKKTGQPYNEAINQLANQTNLLSMVNVIAVQQRTESIGKQLEVVSEKLDALDQKATSLLKSAKMHNLITLSEIKSKALVAIEEALYANQKQSDARFLRLHIIPLRRAFADLDTLLRTLLTDLSHQEVMENIHFIMLLADLKNKAAFVLGQTHIRLEEDELAQGYFQRNTDSNLLLRNKLEALKKTGAFTPHIISQQELEVLKVDVTMFKSLETQAAILSDQNQLALDLKVPQRLLLSEFASEIKMLEPS